MDTLAGKTLFITGASRGIGKAIALRAAKDKANIIIASKTTEQHPTLPGTIYTTADECEKIGGKALPLKLDVRNENAIQETVTKAIDHFGGIDILINNASAIFLSKTIETPIKRYDLMHHVNVRATFICSQACIPALQKSENPHILNLSPPLNLNPKWFKNHVAYTMTKYGMSMCSLGMAEELKSLGIAVNSLWPYTIIATSALRATGENSIEQHARTPEIMANAAHIILTKNSRECTGNFFIDELLLRDHNVTDFGPYAVKKGEALQKDYFID
ncbi:MAG: SDR family oxidoreductase [Oligoflexales bacterium]